MLTWVYDTREIRPFRLAIPNAKWFDDGAFYEEGLPEGDITCDLDGERVSCVIERKSLNDYLNCCARERERFDSELARLATYTVSYVIIEATYAQIRAGTIRSKVNGVAAWHSIAHWETVYPTIHFHPCTNRAEGEMWAKVLLEEAARHSVAFGG